MATTVTTIQSPILVEDSGNTRTENDTKMNLVDTTLQYQLTPENGGTNEIWPGLVKALRVKRVLVKSKVADVRGFEADFSLDKQGFQWCYSPTIQKTWDDDDEIRQVYYPECEALLKKMTGASHAFAFNHVLRSEDWATVQKDLAKYKDNDLENRSANNCYIHVDYSYRGAEQYYQRLVVNGKRDDLKQLAANPRRRWCLINLWRPRKVVNRNALRMADAHSITDDELAEQTIRWLKPEELTEEMKANPKIGNYQAGAPDTYMWAVKPPADPASHKWYYASQMSPDEALLFKMYDSRNDGRAKRVPHTSFESELDNGPPRESVEVRLFAFWEDEALDA